MHSNSMACKGYVVLPLVLAYTSILTAQPLNTASNPLLGTKQKQASLYKISTPPHPKKKIIIIITTRLGYFNVTTIVLS